MGGKTATTTQGVQIPPEVMARYNAVNTRAETAASKPFQAYSQDPSAFVAPLTATQQAGIQNINQAAGMTQPYFNTAAGLTMGGAQAVGPLTAQQIQQYQNPFTQSVVDATRAGLQQQQGQQLSQQQSEAIRAGAFGGDRAGLQRAQLMGQQGLATAQAISPLYQQAYQNAVQTAMGQQGVRAQDLQRQLAAGQQLGGLGATAQQAALAGAQAQLGAGTAEQQTEQAGKTALYNQFLQERGYDFQTAQFLANIAMGTGALSGSTTTTAQPIPFMSDEREKTNIQPLGKGLYAYDYKDDVRRAEEEGRPMPPKRVGPMAQDIEERSPGLVGDVNGHKVVKGLAPQSMGGAVLDLGPGEYRERYAPGGLVSSDDIRAILESQRQSFGPFAQAGLYGGNPQQGGVGKAGYIPGGSLPTPKLMTAGAAPRLPESTVSQAMGTAEKFGLKPRDLYDYGRAGINKVRDMTRQGPSRAEPPAPSSQGAVAASASMPSVEWNEEDRLRPGQAYGGLVGYAGGGGVDKDDPMASYGAQGPGLGIPTEAPDIKPLEAAKPPSTQPKSVMSDIMDVAKTAASIYAMSDARMKDNIEQVGELYDGQPIYRYNMKGSPKTQLGLMAQDLERSGHGDAVAGLGGVKMVDYKRATDVAAGLAPRHGYQRGGVPEAYREYVEEASRETGIPARFLAAKIQQEGQFRPEAVGAAGEIGMTQVLPSTARRPGFGVAPVDPDVLRSDPREQILFGARYLAGRGRAAGVEDWNDPDQVAKALRAYNAGGDPNYVRNVFQHLPRFSGEGLGRAQAYAGEQGQAPASAAIEGAAGAPQGLGQARAAAAKQGASAAPERSALAGFLPVKFGTRTLANPKGEEFGSAGEFITSRQFIQPLLEGIGAMASSQSLSGVGAALQGLGAASRAYTGLEKEMAGIQQTQETTQQTAASTASQLQQNIKNASFVQNGKEYVLLANGTPVLRSMYNQNPGYYGELAGAAQYRAFIERTQGAKPLTDLRPPFEEPPAATPRAGDLKGKTQEGELPQPISTETPKFLSGRPTPFSIVGDSAQGEIDRDVSNAKLRTGSQVEKAQEETRTGAATIQKQADGYRDIATQFDKLAYMALSLPTQGPLSQGPLNQIQTQWANYVNAIMDTASVPKEYRIKPTEVGLRQGMEKVQAALELTQGSQSRDALAVAMSAVPNAQMSREGFITAYAPERVRLQRAMDEARYIQDYQRMYEKKHQAAFPDGWSIQGAKRAFLSDNPPDRERDDVERMKWLMSNNDPRSGQAYWLLYSQKKVPTYYVDRQTGSLGYRRYFEGYR